MGNPGRAEAGPRGRCPICVGRDRELRILSETASAVLSEGAALAVVTGEAGVGKTRLVAEFLETLPDDWRSTIVLSTSDGPASDLLRLAGTVSRSDEPSESLGRSLAAEIGDRRDGAPFVLVVEDLHSLEPHWVSEIGAAARALATDPVLILTTFRLGQHRPGAARQKAVAQLLRLAGAVEVRVPPLTLPDVCRMAAAMAPQRSDVLADDLFERTGGNPLFVEEVLHADDPGVPWTVTEAVLGRVERMSAGARRVAEFLAIAGEPLRYEVLDMVEGGAASATLELIDAFLAVDDPDTGLVALRHAVVGEALELRMGNASRKAVHGQLATALEATGDVVPERLVRHWSAAGEHGCAARWAGPAADRMAEGHAYARACDLYEVALRQLPADTSEAGALCERAAVVATRAGRLEHAANWARTAEAQFRKGEDHERAAEVWLNPVLRVIPKPTQRARDVDEGSITRLADAALDALRAGDEARAAPLLLRCIERARADEAWEDCVDYSIWYGDVSGTWAALDAWDREARSAGDIHQFEVCRSMQANFQFILGDVEQTTSSLRATLTEAQLHPEVPFWQILLAAYAALLGVRGDLREAEEAACRMEGEQPWGTLAGLAHATIAYERGQLDAARDALSPYLYWSRLLGDPIAITPGLTLEAAIAHAAGRPRDALAALDEAHQVDPAVLSYTGADRCVIAARIGFELDEVERLERAVARLAEHARTASGAAIQGAASHVEAFRMWGSGRPDEAAGLFELAAHSYVRAPRNALAAEAWADAAAAALAAGRDHARALDSARALCGTRGLLRIQRRVDELDARARVSTPLPPELSELTSRELDVVRLVAQGRTNREIGAALFLSEGTVRNYLSRCFAKLGVRRRAEVVALLARHEAIGS